MRTAIITHSSPEQGSVTGTAESEEEAEEEEASDPAIYQESFEAKMGNSELGIHALLGRH